MWLRGVQNRQLQRVGVWAGIREEDALRAEAHGGVSTIKGSTCRHGFVAVDMLAEVKRRKVSGTVCLQVLADEGLNLGNPPTAADHLHLVQVSHGDVRRLQSLCDRRADRIKHAGAPPLQVLPLHWLRKVSVLKERLHAEEAFLVGAQHMLQAHSLLLQLLQCLDVFHDTLSEFGLLVLERLQHRLRNLHVDQVTAHLLASPATEDVHGHGGLAHVRRAAEVHHARLRVARTHVVEQDRGFVLGAVGAAEVQIEGPLQRRRRRLVDQMRPRQAGDLGGGEQGPPLYKSRLRVHCEYRLRDRAALRSQLGQGLGKVEDVARDLLNGVRLLSHVEAQAPRFIHAQSIRVEHLRHEGQILRRHACEVPAQLQRKEHRRLGDPTRCADDGVVSESADLLIEGHCCRRLPLRVLVVHDLERLARRHDGGLEELRAEVDAQKEGGRGCDQESEQGDAQH
mmetsp:Transcript_49461/g.159699  ORF Transcript_49461/g.159699 Transcript_49461/m.159699 type:complete len:453 (+) Transcript_49461:1666-3024(+)